MNRIEALELAINMLQSAEVDIVTWPPASLPPDLVADAWMRLSECENTLTELKEELEKNEGKE